MDNKIGLFEMLGNSIMPDRGDAERSDPKSPWNQPDWDDCQEEKEFLIDISMTVKAIDEEHAEEVARKALSFYSDPSIVWQIEKIEED